MDLDFKTRTIFWRCAAVLLMLNIAACGGGSSSPPDGNGQNKDPNSPSTLFKINGTPETSVHENAAYQFVPSVENAKGAVSFNVTNKPQWAAFNPSNGELTGTPSSADVGVTRNVIISAKDSVASASLAAFDLQVTGAASGGSRPYITSTPLTAITEEQNYSYQVTASDDLGATLNYRLREAPLGMTSDASGLIQWQPLNGDRGAHNVIMEVLDSGNPSRSVTQEFSVTVAPSTNTPIPQGAWQLRFADREEDSNSVATNAFDGRTETMWHTRFSSGGKPPPHELQIDLGALYDISGFRYLPRQDLNQPSGRIAEYEFYTSVDGTNWGDPVAVGSFNSDAKEKEVVFPRVTASFVRLVATRSLHASSVTSVAELNVLGAAFSGNDAPTSRIDAPANDITIGVGESLNFTATASDPDNDDPLSIRWEFGASGVPSVSVEDPGSIRFDKPGTFVVRANVMDAAGRADVTPGQRVIKVQNTATAIPSAKTSIHYVESEEKTAFDGKASNAIDSNPATAWSTARNPPQLLPREIQLNLGSAYAVDSLKYTPTQGSNGRVEQYRIFVSDNGRDWGKPVAIGEFSNDAGDKQIFFPPKFGQFVRLVARADLTDGEMSAAELAVEGSCTKPFVKLIQPMTRGLFSDPMLTIKSSVCLNPSLHAGYGIKYVIDGNVTRVVTDPPYSMTTELSKSEHVVEAYVVDAQGRTISGTSSYDKATVVGIGDYYVAMGDSLTYGVGDDDASDNISRDERNRDGGYTSVLNDALTSAKGKPHVVANEGIPGDLVADGVARLAGIFQRHPQVKFFLLLYGTNDASGVAPTPSGLGLQAGSAGYAGSFKDYMQRMIDTIKSQGGQPYLAKAPIVTANNSTLRNQRISEFNQVVDELASANNLATPADFYSFFATRTDLLIDGIHPNGAGYKEVAKLWLNALSR